ncbi:MAG: hypothetical protein FD180_3497 [Planctomycetota bacterium]|nr:MAG: hypothetical protein FD180_3497 [Planctomycetota bacterium]
MRSAFVLAMLFAATAASADPPPWEADAKVLLEGVKEIAGPGVPGTIAAWGAKAFPVVLAGAGGDAHVPVVAAARLGRGRIVAFAHDGYGSAAAQEKGDTGTLMVNAVRWAAGTARAPKIGVVGSDLATFLGAKGLDAAKIEGSKVALSLGGLDAVCVFDCELGPAAIDALDRFIADGNGVVAGVTGWGWSQVHGGADVRGNALNRLVAPAGLGWTADFAKKTSGDGFAAGEIPGAMTHAGRAIEALEASAEGESGFSPADLARASVSAIAAVLVLPAGASDMRAHLAMLARDRADRLVPTEKAPLRAADALDRFLLTAQLEEARLQPPDKVPALPGATAFPGAVPKDARGVERDFAIDAGIPGWQSTGLYVPAGQPVTVTVPEAAAGAKLSLRIGAHTDTIFHLDVWPRAPDVSSEIPVTAAKTVAASPFGGLLYLVIPEKCALGTFSIHVSGAVEAPYYVLGKTTLDSWKRLRGAPGPWAELGSSKVILTVPSSCIRDLDDPKSLMEFWDRVLDAAADLATIPKERKRPERYVADVEISAGYMHSGYPIMTHLDAAPRMVSLATMEKGDWGLFHELGHNHQQPDWTFEGTGEVTCNLWSLYISETLCNLKPEQAHEALKDREKRSREHCRNGADYAKWKKDPFLALMMYLQLKEQFGWQPFKEAFAAYRALPAAERPLTDQQQRDQWLVRISRAAKKDLGPFFDVWGVPTSAESRESLKKLPRWMPLDFPGRK